MDNINLNRENGQKLWAADWNKLVSTINLIIDAVNNQNNLPGITKLSQLINDSGFITQEDVKGKVNKGELAEVATSGSYNDLKDKPSQMTGPQGPEGKSAYQVAVQNGFIGTPQLWLNSLKGEPGQDGVIGLDGADGKSAYDLAVELGYEGTLELWLESLHGLDGTNGLDGQNGLNGITPSIDPTTKHWIIGSTDTGVLAEGLNGTNGTNGINGITPHIDPITKHWMIGETDTNILAEGVNGQDGTNGINGQDGVTPHIDSTTGNWFIGNTDTGVKAHGFSGDYNDLLNKPAVLLVPAVQSEQPQYVEIDGIKWATKNLGALTMYDSGYYYQWGDIVGYPSSAVGNDKNFSWSDYKYSSNGSDPLSSDMTKYNSSDGKRVLDLSDDAAYIASNGVLRMPTANEIISLYQATNQHYTTDYNGSGISGLVLTSTTDSSKKLFFPVGGACRDGSITDEYASGYYWTSSVNSSNLLCGRYFGLNEYGANTYGDDWYRRSGMMIRPVVTDYNNINLPTSVNAAIVAITGSYNDLVNKPTIPAAQIQADWNQTDNSALDYIKNKPNIVTQSELEESEEVIAAAINQLNENMPAPLIQADWNQEDSAALDYIKNKPNIPSSSGTQVQADWSLTDNTLVDYIKNKPSIPNAPVLSNWNETDASSLAYIANKPTIPAAQVLSDWNATTGMGVILNKPTIPAAQVQSDWNATTGLGVILNKPTIPTVPANETATNGGNTLSVVTTGDKYNWNNKANVWQGTQAQYDALSPNYDSNTIYIITQ